MERIQDYADFYGKPLQDRVYRNSSQVYARVSVAEEKVMISYEDGTSKLASVILTEELLALEDSRGMRPRKNTKRKMRSLDLHPSINGEVERARQAALRRAQFLQNDTPQAKA